MKFKTVRYVAGAALIPLTLEALPHTVEASDCGADISFNLCSAEEDFLAEPRNIHTPHIEFETEMPSAFRWIASGQVNSTSTGPSYSGWLAAGESILR